MLPPPPPTLPPTSPSPPPSATPWSDHVLWVFGSSSSWVYVFTSIPILSLTMLTVARRTVPEKSWLVACVKPVQDGYSLIYIYCDMKTTTLDLWGSCPAGSFLAAGLSARKTHR